MSGNVHIVRPESCSGHTGPFPRRATASSSLQTTSPLSGQRPGGEDGGDPGRLGGSGSAVGGAARSSTHGRTSHVALWRLRGLTRRSALEADRDEYKRLYEKPGARFRKPSELRPLPIAGSWQPTSVRWRSWRSRRARPRTRRKREGCCAVLVSLRVLRFV